MKLHFAFLLLAAFAAPVSAQSQSAADRQLQSLYDGYSLWAAKEYGSIEDAKGEYQPADYLPKVDPASHAARAAYLKELLTKLDAIPIARLSLDEQTNAAVLRNILESSLSDARFREWEMPVNSDSNFWTYLDESDPLDDAAAYRRYIARMRDVPRYFAEHIANMRAGLARGFTPPAATLGRPRRIDRRLHRRARRQCFHAAFSHDALDDQRRRPGEAARRGQGGDRARRSSPPIATCSPSIRDTYVPGARKTVGASDAARRRRLLPRRGARIYHAAADPRGDPPDRPQGSRPDRRGHEAHHGRGRVQGQLPRLPQIPPHRSAVHRPHPRRSDGRLGLCGQARRRPAQGLFRSACRAAASPSSRCRTRSRPSTPPAAAGSRRAR